MEVEMYQCQLVVKERVELLNVRGIVLIRQNLGRERGKISRENRQNYLYFLITIVVVVKNRLS